MDAHELEWLRRVRDLSQQLGSETDLARLPPRILDAALELTGAERALLVQLDPPDVSGQRKITVLAGRGFRQRALDGTAGAVPRAAVERTLQEGRGLTTRRPADRTLLSELTSVQALGVRSLVCVPLRLRGETVGALYLDDRRREDLFRVEDLPTLQTFAAQAAISLELAQEQAQEQAQTQPAPTPRYLVGESPAMVALLEDLARVSRSREPVLVRGEPGTELGLVARELHAQGPDRAERFRLVPAGDPAAAARLLGSDGEPGALTRAGTLALADVEALDGALQRVLAHALAEGSFVAPGGSKSYPVLARIVALSHGDLTSLLRAGQFRADLFYRLDVQRLVVPPLRQRTDDLPALCRAALERLGAALAFTPGTMERLQQYAWPGNLLELEAELKRLSALGSPRIQKTDLSEPIREGRGLTRGQPNLAGLTLAEVEENLVRQVLTECEGVKARAARQLGIPRSTLYHLIERYGIE